MESDGSTAPKPYYKTNLNKCENKQPNLKLIKQEVLQSHDVHLFKCEVRTMKSEPVTTEDEFKLTNLHTSEPEVIINQPLQLKSEILDQNCDAGINENIFIKEELLHEELDIKNEDEQIQQFHLDNKYNLPKHTRIKPFTCNLCDRSFGRKAHLQNHLRTHTGKKPFKCNSCDRSFLVNRDLVRHLRTHTGEKPNKCHICDYCCGQNSDLKRHLRTHTGEKPHKCNICDFSCGQSCTLKRHLRTHTGEKPFTCNYCDYCCAQKGHLQSHLITAHWTEAFQVQSL